VECTHKIYWEATNVATGTVKWFSPTKGFGFIQPDSGRQGRVHAHFRRGKSRPQQPQRGRQVSFDVVANRGKESAENLRVG
jgi:CspA family cold shock protein